MQTYSSPLRLFFGVLVFLLMVFSCSRNRDTVLKNSINALDINRGEIALCGSGNTKFGTVEFGSVCSEKIREDFNLATALLHSFEYSDAEKVFAKVVDVDPGCVMGYWGLAMCYFHPLWAPPDTIDLKKGAAIINIARSIVGDKSSAESQYLEAIASIYDDYKTLDHHTRVLKFEAACNNLHVKNPKDKEAAIFYALSLDASADPKDKAYKNQKKAGEILNEYFKQEPNHPGVAHYLIHNYDSPELAELGLNAARKYAAIASASAHAQHMPSHIFTRLGLWDESVKSNLASISAAQCYASQSSMKGHWDEELHGMDYLVYAYLQEGDDAKAKEQIEYLKAMLKEAPENSKAAYAFSSMPSRYALERHDWAQAKQVALEPTNLPWNNFPWERANVIFCHAMGAVRLHDVQTAATELKELKAALETLQAKNDTYKGAFVTVQVKTVEGWILLEQGKANDAVSLMREAADLEDGTSKHPVTPGEVLPARELLGDMFFELKDYEHAIDAYQQDLLRHKNRFNGLVKLALAEAMAGHKVAARKHRDELLAFAFKSADRSDLKTLEKILK